VKFCHWRSVEKITNTELCMVAVTESMSIFQSVSVFCQCRFFRCRFRWSLYLVNEKLLLCEKLIHFQLTFVFTERLVGFRNQEFVLGNKDLLIVRCVLESDRLGLAVARRVPISSKYRHFVNNRHRFENRHRQKTDTDLALATDTEDLHSSTRLKNNRRLLSVNRTTAQAYFIWLVSGPLRYPCRIIH